MKGGLFLTHGSDDTTKNAPSIQAERLKAAGIKTMAISSTENGELERALEALAREGLDTITIMPMSFATNMLDMKPIPEDVLKKIKLPEGMKMPEFKPPVIPKSIFVDGREIEVRVSRPFGHEPGMRSVIESMLDRYGAVPGKTAVVMVGHGSYDGTSEKAVQSNVSYARDKGFDAYPCYNEMNEPTVEQAMDEVLGKGYEDILIIPLFVSPSIHSSVQVPEKLKLAQGETQREETVDGRIVRIRYTNEVGLEPGVADILRAMIEE